MDRISRRLTQFPALARRTARYPLTWLGGERKSFWQAHAISIDKRANGLSLGLLLIVECSETTDEYQATPYSRLPCIAFNMKSE